MSITILPEIYLDFCSSAADAAANQVNFLAFSFFLPFHFLVIIFLPFPSFPSFSFHFVSLSFPSFFSFRSAVQLTASRRKGYIILS